MTRISIKIRAPWFTGDFIMGEKEAFKYLKAFRKDHAHRGELKVTTQVVEDENKSK